MTIDGLSRGTVVAHRGGLWDGPENTQEAFDACVSRGFVIETDVVQLSDGDFAVHHDTTLGRTTTGSGNVSAINRETWLGLSNNTWGGSGTLMTLDQLLDRYGQTAHYLIDRKQGSVSDFLAQLNNFAWAVEHVICSSTSTASLSSYANADFQTWLIIPSNAAAASNTAAAVASAGIQYVGLKHDEVSDATITTYAENESIRAFCWTVNGWNRAKSLYDLGVFGVTSDRPEYVARRCPCRFH